MLPRLLGVAKTDVELPPGFRMLIWELDSGHLRFQVLPSLVEANRAIAGEIESELPLIDENGRVVDSGHEK
jgi:hypothetical protein